MMGTPAQLAPELALGKPPIDGRTDLYGLGCVAYWLITGQPVFERQGSTAMMMAHLNEPPIPPGKRGGVPLPDSQERAILKCLAKEQSQRPASADVLGRMLLDGGDLGSWNSDDAENWWRENIPGDAMPLYEEDKPAESSPSAFTTI